MSRDEVRALAAEVRAICVELTRLGGNTAAVGESVTRALSAWENPWGDERSRAWVRAVAVDTLLREARIVRGTLAAHRAGAVLAEDGRAAVEPVPA